MTIEKGCLVVSSSRALAYLAPSLFPLSLSRLPSLASWSSFSWSATGQLVHLQGPLQLQLLSYSSPSPAPVLSSLNIQPFPLKKLLSRQLSPLLLSFTAQQYTRVVLNPTTFLHPLISTTRLVVPNSQLDLLRSLQLCPARYSFLHLFRLSYTPFSPSNTRPCRNQLDNPRSVNLSLSTRRSRAEQL